MHEGTEGSMLPSNGKIMTLVENAHTHKHTNEGDPKVCGQLEFKNNAKFP